MEAVRWRSLTSAISRVAAVVSYPLIKPRITILARKAGNPSTCENGLVTMLKWMARVCHRVITLWSAAAALASIRCVMKAANSPSIKSCFSRRSSSSRKARTAGRSYLSPIIPSLSLSLTHTHTLTTPPPISASFLLQGFSRPEPALHTPSVNSPDLNSLDQFF